MSHVSHFRPGLHLFVCDICGRVFHSDRKRKTWDGLVVCDEDWDPRHPQEAVRGRKDKQSVSDPRPEPADVFLSYGDVTADDL